MCFGYMPETSFYFQYVVAQDEYRTSVGQPQNIRFHLLNAEESKPSYLRLFIPTRSAWQCDLKIRTS